MKILYIYEKMPGTYQKYLLNLLELVQSSLNVKTLVYKECNNQADYVAHTYGVKDYFQRILNKLKLSNYKSLDKKIFFKFDIIHLQHSYLFNKVNSLIRSGDAPRIIITLRGGDTYVKPWTTKSWQNFYQNSKHIDAFITMSEHQKQYLKKWGVSENKIHVIPISFGNYSEAVPKYPNKGTLKLVSAFRMTWEKNIEGTVRFASLLRQKGIMFHYDIYGDGNDLGQLYYLIDKYDLQQYITVKGKIDNDLLKSELGKYDFFVQLSLSEAFPTSVLEAQSLGLPCIVSDSDGLPEAVLKGKSAIVYPYNNIEGAVNECLGVWNDKELYFSYSKEAINYMNNNFTLQHEKDKLEKLYKSLI